MSHEPQTQEMALALYASTAATAAIRALRDARLLGNEVIGPIVTTLMACRAAAGASPRIELHIDLLTDMLISGVMD